MHWEEDHQNFLRLSLVSHYFNRLRYSDGYNNCREGLSNLQYSVILSDLKLIDPSIQQL